MLFVCTLLGDGVLNEKTKQSLYNICANSKDVLLIDVMNYLHRFMWVHKTMQVSVGDDVVCTGHLFGFTRFLTCLKTRFPQCSIVLALDGKPEDRMAINPNYKAQRAHTYEVDAEMQELLCMCSVLDGVYVCLDDTKEADDVIYSVSKKVNALCLRNNIAKNIYVLSNDKDMFQCVTKTEPSSVKIIRKFGTGKDWFRGADLVDYNIARNVFEGVAPDNLAKYRAIIGDTSDNLKGYSRFRKSNAVILAENFDVTDDGLVLKKGATFNSKWNSFLNVIYDDFSIFKNNYDIMKLRDFDFELSYLHDDVLDLEKAVDSIVKYRLFTYKANVCCMSPYKNELTRLFALRGY